MRFQASAPAEAQNLLLGELCRRGEVILAARIELE